MFVTAAFSFKFFHFWSKLRSLVSVSINIQNFHEIVNCAVGLTVLLYYLTHSQNACQFFISDKMNLVAEVSLEHFVQCLFGLRECNESGLTVVIRMSADLLERLDQ